MTSESENAKMEHMENGTKYVTYRWAITSGLTVVGLLVTILIFTINSHASRPHEGAISREEYRELREDLRRLEDKVDALLRRE